MIKNDIAVFCVCRNESRLLPLWVKYYSNLFGLENIYVFDDNSTEKYDLELINYEMLDLGRNPAIERFGVHDYQTLWSFIVDKYIELLKEYKWVIHVDTDDFIVALPDLKYYINSHNPAYFRCAAYEILQDKNEYPLDWNIPILRQRQNWIRITNLDKTCIVSKRLDFNGPGSWVLGNHYACGLPDERPNPEMILIHLHRIDYDNYRKKYFVNDPGIQNNSHFESVYGGYPLFWRETDLNEYFYKPGANRQWGAAGANIEPINDKYKGAF